MPAPRHGARIPACTACAASVYETLGQFARACADQEAALQVARNVGDRQSQLGALLDLGVLWSRRDYQCAGEYYRRAVKLAQQIGKPTAIARSLNRMGSWYVAVEEPDEAMQCHRQALSLFEDSKDLSGVAETLGLLGRATYATGGLRESADYYERALTLLKKLDDRRGLVTTLLMQSVVRDPSYLHFALVVPQSGLSENLDDAKEALRVARDIHWRLGEAQVLCKLAHCLGARGDYAGALAGATPLSRSSKNSTTRKASPAPTACSAPSISTSCATKRRLPTLSNRST